MAINLKFDLIGNPEPPSIILANRNGNKLGQLNVNVDSIDVSDKFNAASELSFTLNKYIDGKLAPLWEKVVDFKLVYCPEWDLWFEIKVELDETTETVKTVFCTQLGQAELSQIMVYNIHINEEGDPNWNTNNETYKSTILYDPKNTDASLLHRLLKDKAPHYSIAYVDESIQRIQRQFSFDGTSIYDAFNEIATEIGCLFVYNSNSIKGGKPNRTISVYDLQQNCNDCGHRGEFTDKCPKCESTNIKYGYGEDTTIFVTSDELATEGIQLVTDTDAVKNCFKLEGGDDLMTATIRNCNPNGSDYIWYFSDALKEDMSKELVERLESYNDKYQDCYTNKMSELNKTIVNQYNALVNKYKEYYNTKSTCLNCGHKDYFQEQCPQCNSQNILNGQSLQTIPIEITGYANLMTAYYNTIDLLLYLESGLMPNSDIESNKTTAKEQIKFLITPILSPVAVNVKEVKDITETTANSAILSMAKALIKSTYKVDIVGGSSSLSETVYTDITMGEYKKWTGKFIVTNYSNKEDSATSEIIEVFVGNDTKIFVEQKINKALYKENTDDYSITGLFAKEYGDFCAELKKYALNPLNNFSKACDTAISILQEQDIGSDGSNEDDELEKEKKMALYNALYSPYFTKQQAINKEIKVRENEISIIKGVWDKSDENNPKCTTWGLQQYIEKCQQDIQEELDFKKHLGDDLWLEFCTYRREDSYSNSNYISDGLDNAELFKRALEFIEVAEEEIFKSAELQHSISATLNNLLSLPKFKPLLKSFKTGNWIRVQVDDEIYKLRLLEYIFGYGDSESISVEFSDVTKIKNGVTDVKEILEQASSMATSYDSVQRQAEKGNVARSTIDQWLVDGLDSASVQIKNNDSEEILLTKNGLLARSYDDITGTYSPEQFKLTHNILAYTDDDWQTVSSALGKHKYRKWNNSSFVDDEGYGLTSKFVTAGYVTGSQIIGGEIISSNYQIGESGTYLNLIKGDFDFAGGKIVYNADKNRVTLSGVEIQWDTVNSPTIDNIDGLSGITEDIRIIEQGLSATTINGQYVVSPNIIGGYLNIKNYSNNAGVVIDPIDITNEGYIFRVYNGGVTVIGLDAQGNAEFSGTITGSQIIGRNSIFVGNVNKDDNGVYIKDYNEDYAEITEDGKLTCTNVDILGGTLKIGSETDAEGKPIVHTWISTEGALNTYDANISGTIYAGAGSIGGFTIEPIKDENGDIVGGWLYSSGKTRGEDGSIFLSTTNMSGTVSKTTLDDWRLTVGEHFGVTSDGTAYMSNCEITGGSLKMGTNESGYYAWISEDGVLSAFGANINGTINAINGSIGGWTIDTTKICSNNALIGLSSGTDSAQSLLPSGGTSPIRFYAGKLINTFTITTSQTLSPIGVLDKNITVPQTGGFIKSAIIKSLSLDESLFTTKRIQIVSNSEINIFLSTTSIIGESKINIEIEYEYQNEVNMSNTLILEDGSLYANAAKITGTITASDGFIGGLKINNGIKGYQNNVETISLTNEGLSILNPGASIQVGNFNTYYDGKATYWQTNGELRIQGIQSQKVMTEIALMTNSGNVSTDVPVHMTIKIDDDINKVYVQLKSDEPLYNSHSFIIYYQTAKAILSGSHEYDSDVKTFILTINASETTSEQHCIEISGSENGFWGTFIRLGVNGSTWHFDTKLETYISKTSQVSIVTNTLSNQNIVITGNVVSSTSDYTLGLENQYWKGAFLGSSTIVTSDRSHKNTIQKLSDAYSIVFDSLIPVTYKYNDGDSDRLHTGFVAQDVKDAIEAAGLTTQDMAAYCEWEDSNGSIGCALRYEEFIALCVDQIQKLKKRVEELENK